ADQLADNGGDVHATASCAGEGWDQSLQVPARQGQGTFEGRVANQCHQDCQRERTFPSSRAVRHCSERVRQRRAFLHDRSRGPCCPSPRSSILAYGKTLLGQHSRRPATIRCGKTSRKATSSPTSTTSIHDPRQKSDRHALPRTPAPETSR